MNSILNSEILRKQLLENLETLPVYYIQEILDFAEFMDRASVAVDYVYQFLGSHPLLKKETRLREVYERAEEALAELYQEAGRLEFERKDC
jgi:hypothetical protein